MVNAQLDFCDVVRMSFDHPEQREGPPQVVFSCASTISLPGLPPEKNLASRAAGAFLDRYPVGHAPVIEIEKHIPAGGGLGGGSSDAGAVLRLLASACEEKISRESLIEIAAEIGADVPYFLFSGPAIVTGVGERVLPIEIPDLSLYEVLLILPPFGTSTVAIYEAYRRSFPVLDGRQEDLDPAAIALTPGLIHNDFEEIVGELYPALQELLLELRKISDLIFSMSGSGSTLFAIAGEGKALPVDAERRVRAVAADFGAVVRAVRFA